MFRRKKVEPSFIFLMFLTEFLGKKFPVCLPEVNQYKVFACWISYVIVCVWNKIVGIGEKKLLKQETNGLIFLKLFSLFVIGEHHIPQFYRNLRVIYVWQHVFLGNTGWITPNMQNA